MIKKYEFPSQAVAYSELNAQTFTTSFQSQEDAPISVNGFLRIEGAENAVDLGHITLVDAVMDGDDIITPAVLSVGYCVDVMWTDTPPAHIAAFEVNPEIPKHKFA